MTSRTAWTTQPIAAPPPLVQHSQTAPLLSTNSGKDGSTPNLQSLPIEPADETESRTSTDICKSPSWSDFGGNKHKKEQEKIDKEKRETERMIKKHEEKQRAAALKANKRLSKRPPAAMDTQRMPAALRRSSTPTPSNSRASSQDSSWRSSREERRSSITSIGSFLGWSKPSSTKSVASTTPSVASHQSVVSSTAPQLPKLAGMGDCSQLVSSSTQISEFPQGQDGCEPKILDFASHLGAPMDMETSQYASVKPIKAVRISMPPRSLGTPTPSRTNTGSELANAVNDAPPPRSPLRPELGRRGSSETSQATSTQSVVDEERRGRTVSRSRSNESDGRQHTKPSMTSGHATSFTTSRQKDSRAPFPGLPNPRTSSSSNVHSYVQQQRMHSQRLSIASLQDEIAIQNAHDLAASRASLHLAQREVPPTPSDPAESSANSHENLTVKTRLQETGAEKCEEPEPTQHCDNLTEASQKPSNIDSVQLSRTSKVEKILGSCMGLEKETPWKSRQSLKTVSFQNDTNQISTTPVVLPISPITMAALSAASKAEEMKEEQDVKSRNNRFSRALETVNNKRNSILRPSLSKASRPEQPRSILRRSQENPQQQLPRPLPRSSTVPVISVGKQYTALPLSSISATGGSMTPPTPSTVSFQETRGKDAHVAQSTSPNRPSLEVVIEGVDGDGLVRKTSLKRPRSNPQLQAEQPSFDFLPELKHQPLVKPKRTSPPRDFNASVHIPSSSSKLPPSTSETSISLPTAISTLQALPKSPLSLPSHTGPTSYRRSRLSTPPITPMLDNGSRMLSSSNLNPAGKGSLMGKAALEMKPIAKMFVICCKCKYWHDLPSKLYEAMALPRVIKEGDGAQSTTPGKGKDKGKEKGKKAVEAIQGKLFTTVNCPWCAHGMSTACCAGWTTVVYLHERHH